VEGGVPGQVFTVAITEIVAVIGLVPVFVALNEAMFPAPLAANPIAAFELVHEKVPPAGVLTNVVAATVPLLQTAIFAGTVTVGVGFTVMV
jgi:hypothetical protein